MIIKTDGDVRIKGRLQDWSGNEYRPVIGQLGWHSGNGIVGTKIGVITGWVVLNSGYIKSGLVGYVTLRYRDRAVLSSGAGYSGMGMVGYKGDFTFAPNVLVAPMTLNLSTLSDTYFQFWYSHNHTEITINWNIDTSGGNHQLDFLLIGPI